MSTFEKDYKRKPVAGIDYDTDHPMSQDEYEYMTGSMERPTVEELCEMWKILWGDTPLPPRIKQGQERGEQIKWDRVDHETGELLDLTQA